MPETILHHYQLSPYSEKIRLALGLKEILHVFASVGGPALQRSSEFPVDGAVLTGIPDGRRHFRKVHSQEHAECKNRCALAE
jgi:hypothetical protein